MCACDELHGRLCPRCADAETCDRDDELRELLDPLYDPLDPACGVAASLTRYGE